MVEELAVVAGSSVAGAISAAVLERLSRARARLEKKPQLTSNAAKSELASLMFEKGLAAEAITRVYEASQEGRIDRLERDRLLVKYKQQLDAINERIAALQPVADVTDLTELRNGLVSLLENRISALDQKLAELSKEGTKPVIVEKVQVMPVPEKPKEEQEQKQFRSEEKSIDQLQKEIMQALTRLEQVEMDKD